jgi:NAD(P)-dependent dehydrogenase (short-subunit alcohol dehydrogenase family)
MRAALVTGGASGIGRATVDLLLQRGWSVVAADVNAQAAPAGVELVRADVTVEDDVRAAIAHVVDAFGRIDAVINNAGVGGAFGAVTDLDAQEWDDTFAILVRGVFLGVKHAARAMTDGGTIVNTASIAGHVGGMGPLAYSSAKAAVIQLTRLAAVELAPRGIRVNSVSPGVINTTLASYGQRPLEEALAGIQPWREVGQPEHIARAIAFLVSDDARFITGQDVIVDGGMVAAGVRLGDAIGGDPSARGLAGFNRGSTGAGHTVRRRD